MFQSKLQGAAKAIVVILIFCMVGVGILFLDRILTPSKGKSDTFEIAKNNLNAKSFTVDGEEGIYLPKNIITFLIAGIDKNKDEGDFVISSEQQADFIMLLAIDKSNREINVIAIDRDTMVEFDVIGDDGRATARGLWGITNDGLRQIALAHTQGVDRKQRARNLNKAVSGMLFNLRIDHYLTMTMDGIVALNDYIANNFGAIKIKLGENDVGLKEGWEPGNTVTIEGNDSMLFVRARQQVGDGTNVGRMDRQSRYLRAVIDSISQNKEKKWDTNALLGLYRAIEGYSESDYGNIDELQKDMEMIFEVFGSYEAQDTVVLNGERYGEYKYVNYFNTVLTEEQLKEYEENKDTMSENERMLKTPYVAYYPNKEEVQKKIVEIFYRKVEYFAEKS